MPAPINSMQPDPAPPCSSPTARMPAAIAADTEPRFPDSASRAVAHEGAPEPWSATLDRIASNIARSPSVGSRDRCSRKMVSVNVRSVIRDVTSLPRMRICPSRASTIAVRQGSISLLKLCEGTGYAA
jgi:hypothetical protein